MLGNAELAKEKLELAKAESGMDIDKFTATQLYQNGAVSAELAKNLLTI